MIKDVMVRELESRLQEQGAVVDIWQAENAPRPHHASTLHSVFPGSVEAWFRRAGTAERLICLQGMLKLVLCDRRGGSPSEGEVQELFLGEYRYREVIVPPGVLRGWKAVGDRPALVLLTLEGEGGESVAISPEEAAVPYDWEIVMQ